MCWIHNRPLAAGWQTPLIQRICHVTLCNDHSIIELFFLPLHLFHRRSILMCKGWQHFFDQSSNTRFYLKEYVGRIVLAYWLGRSNRNHHHHPVWVSLAICNIQLILFIIRLTGIRGLSMINLPSTRTMMWADMTSPNVAIWSMQVLDSAYDSRV